MVGKAKGAFWSLVGSDGCRGGVSHEVHRKQRARREEEVKITFMCLALVAYVHQVDIILPECHSTTSWGPGV